MLVLLTVAALLLGLAVLAAIADLFAPVLDLLADLLAGEDPVVTYRRSLAAERRCVARVREMDS